MEIAPCSTLKSTNKALKVRLLFSFVFVLMCSSIFAQFSGQVIDSENGLPIEGASITAIANDSILGHSNNKGYFFLCTDTHIIVRISSLGYHSKSIIIAPHSSEKIIWLTPSPISLMEVEIKAALLNSSLLESSVAANRISKQDIRKGKSVSAPEYFNTILGITMQQGTYSTNKLIIRGVGSRASYGTNRIKVYFDEIPLTGGDGLTTFEDTDPLFLSGVEILKGPSSALYGSGLGGTVRLYSNSPVKAGTQIDLQSLAGSFGLFKNKLSIYNSNKKSDITAQFSNTLSKGYRQNNNYLRNNALLKSKLKLNNAKLTFLLHYIGINSQIPSSLDQTTFENKPTAAAENWLAIKGYEKYDKLLGGISHEKEINTSLTNTASIFGKLYNGYELRPFNILNDESSVFGIRERLTWTKNNVTLSGGFEWFSEQYKWQLYETTEGQQGTLFSDNTENRYYLNTFVLGGWNISNKIKVDGGINLNVFRYSVIDHFNAQHINNLSGSYKNALILSPRLGLVYKIVPTHALYISSGHGFSTPSVEEALLPEGNINPNLKPEEGWTIEGGIRGDLKTLGLQYDFGCYRTNVNNMLVTKRLSESEFMSINAGKVYHQGIEAGFTKLFKPATLLSLALKASYSYSIHRFIDYVDDNEIFSGNELPGVPQQQAFFSVDGVIHEQYTFHINYNYTGFQYLNDANTKEYPSFQTINFKGGYQYKWNNNALLKLNFGIDNVLNRQYASMLLINAPQFGNKQARYYYPALPRNFYVSISFSK